MPEAASGNPPTSTGLARANAAGQAGPADDPTSNPTRSAPLPVQLEEPGQVLHVIVGPADAPHLDTLGGPEAVAQELADHIERLSLPDALRALARARPEA